MTRGTRERRFDRTIGIDYSGAATATTRLPGLRVYAAEGDAPAVEVRPTADGRRHWSRRGMAEWLAARLGGPARTLVGIDHGFSFPLRAFEVEGLPRAWPAFLDAFAAQWPTDADGVSVQDVREGRAGRGSRQPGDTRWRRVCEQRVRAKSVFHFDVPGSVAKSTHAGLPWLRFLRRALGERIHCWPFDGWRPPQQCSVLAEVYPALWSARYERGGRSGDQHDAYAVAEALRAADRDGSLDVLFEPSLSEAESAAAALEGWILGIR